MHTPEQAKELWCPMVRLAPAPMHPALNRLLHENEVRQPHASCCVADRCAMWRWVPKNGTFLAIVDDGGGMKREVKQWGGVPPTHGYCGLAGSVHGVAA